MKWNVRLNAFALCAALAFGAFDACVPRAAFAAPVQWRSGTLDYAAEGKDIKDVLRDVGASQGLAVRIAPGVTGSVSGKFHLPPRRFLDMLAASFGFVWYYDGEALDIVTAADLQSQLVKLDTASTDTLRSTLAQMRVADERFPVTYNRAEGTALVNGPPRYVQMVQDIAARLDSNASRRGGTVVRVFPLDHAWAADRSVPIDGQHVTMQGVASVLNGIYHPQAPKDGNGNSGGAGGRDAGAAGAQGVTRNTPIGDVNGQTYTSPYVPPPIPGGGANGATSKGMFAGLTGSPSPAVAAAIAPPPGGGASSGASARTDDTLPVIVADTRTNAVIVRDSADHMSQYDSLIHRLDVKPQLIEIEAHIIEVDDNALQQLGVDWTAHNSHVDIQTGTGSNTQLGYDGTVTQNFGQTSLAGSVLASASPVGASVAAVLGDAGRYLMARISAMQQDNTAKIDASPKVVTLNNIEAVMDDKQQFFVPVQGYTAGDLYSISTGISLRVLPMVVQEDGKTRIKLDVAIQDGQLTSQTVSNLPVVQNSNISTQAFINEGDALLIAGYRADTDTNGVTGVPGLSKIPLIGGLFRTNNRQKSHRERLFLLLPHVIEPT
ncbi:MULTISPECIES: type III secretion system outer membrane ring subunit SctC [unclassified Paraburkholderia]|uniref:type III secretion system outer membrane ring subunit SctC n=1 Tax=unclassified Paraburkholderia TaxID=2615204 RepID=UPI002AB1436E|nr:MULTISPECIES: type III secretion system outer membrane ring subunit SctC [unclassified Paraburkholderia]